MLSFGEIKRRKMFQVTAVYAVVAWLIVEVITSIEEPLRLPDWSDTLVIVLLGLGFPVMLIVSWMFNVTPDGLVRDTEGASREKRSGPTMELVLLGIVVVAVGWLFYRTEFSNQISTEVPSTIVAPIAATPSARPNSVAVLPFDNLSAESDNAYFSAGLHEEVLNQLAKLRKLRVISRTSAMHYADSDLTIPEIAKELNVAAVMEGSVQYADGRVRVHAQLIDATTDEHIWSETYDRDFADIFAIESDIAASIANALSIELSIAEQESLERRPEASVDAHLLYLGAIPQFGTPTQGGGPPQFGRPPQGGPPPQGQQANEERLDRLDRTIQAAPNFAPPYVERAGIYIQSLRTPGSLTRLLDQREGIEALAVADLEKSLDIDPTLGRAYSWLGMIHRYNWRGTSAKTAFEKALDLSPNDPDVLTQYGYFLSNIGQYEQAIAMAKGALEFDPYNPEPHAALGQFKAAAGQYEAAIGSFETAIERGAAWVLPLAANVEILRGNESQAARHLRASEPMTMTIESPQWPALTAYMYARLNLDKDAERVLARFDQLKADQHVPAAAAIMAHLARGEKPEALNRLIEAVREKAPYEAFNLLMGIAVNVYRDPILDEPEFAAARQKLAFKDD